MYPHTVKNRGEEKTENIIIIEIIKQNKKGTLIETKNFCLDRF